MLNQLQICKNCSNQYTGKFCNNCGEKVFDNHSKRVTHLFGEAFHFLTHFEGSFFTTLKTIIIKPGQFSLDYCNGIRKKYFKPVSLFMLLVVLYLLFPRFQGLNMKLNTYASNQYDYTWVSIPLIKKAIREKNVDYKTIALIYDAKSQSVSKLALFLMLPLGGGLLLFLLFWVKKKLFFDHFILSVELNSFFIALHFLSIPFISFLVASINKSWESFFWDDSKWLEIITIIIDITFFTLAIIKFYAQKWYVSLLLALLYGIIFVKVILYIYKLLVLVVTLLLI
jgi:hypothetical protein